MIAGLMLVGVGFLRLGTYIKYIPHPVTVGFTAGIAVDHLREPAARPLRADARRAGAGRVPAEARMRSRQALRTR